MRSLYLVAAALGIGSMLLAKDEVSTPATPTQLIVTVEARKGKEVPVMKPGDIVVFQKNSRLQVTNLKANAALELYILIDDASSTNLGLQLDDLRKFIQTQPPETSIGIGYMRNATVEFTQPMTADHALAAKGLRLPLGYPGVMPSPFLSLSDLISRWPASAARHEVILVSSGIDPLGGRVSDPYLDAAIEHAQRAGVVVYAIYEPASGHGGHSIWQMNWGQNHLAQIAEETGGESYMLGYGPLVSFSPYLAEISEHLAHQYVVTFLVTPGKKSGLQQVRLTTEVPNAELVSAHQVFVPAGH